MREIAISINNLSRDFDSIRALDGLTLDIPAGIVFGFLGPNGAGKTTTIRLLLGLLEPTGGSSEVLGFNPCMQGQEVRSKTGALLEHEGVYTQLTAEDNLEFFGRAYCIPEKERKERIHTLLTKMGLWERRKERAGDWSRGMRQKLALARTMIHKPELVLLDEPTAGLDVSSAVAVRDDLTSISAEEGVTVFLTTHNMAEAEKICNLIAVIRQGKLIAVGHPDELRAKAGRPQVEIIGRGFNQETIEKIRDFPEVSTVSSQNSHLTIELRNNSNSDPAPYVSLLVSAGAQVEEVHRGSASLEDVFLTLMEEENV